MEGTEMKEIRGTVYRSEREWLEALAYNLYKDGVRPGPETWRTIRQMIDEQLDAKECCYLMDYLAYCWDMEELVGAPAGWTVTFNGEPVYSGSDPEEARRRILTWADDHAPLPAKEDRLRWEAPE